MNKLTLKLRVHPEADYGPLFTELNELGLPAEPINAEDWFFHCSQSSMTKFNKIVRILNRHSEIISRAELIANLHNLRGNIFRVAVMLYDETDVDE